MPLDFYTTPKWQVDALLDRVYLHGRILECCAGDGSISDVLRVADSRHGITGVLTNDIDPQHATDFHQDATKDNAWKVCPKDVSWVVSNPPFKDAFKMLELAYSTVGRVAFLLRLSFLEPTKERGLWLEEHPPLATIVLPRWSYTKNGKSDSVTTAWCVWNRHVGNFGRQSLQIHSQKPIKGSVCETTPSGLVLAA